jgi:hypothetical protein
VVEAPVSSEAYVAPPISVTPIAAGEQLQVETAFGMDFPQPLNPPPVGDRGLITDPVTSGGASASGGDDDESEDNQNGQ